MTQLTSPFLEGKYGWSYGESGWNGGMDENLLKFSFMFDRNIDGIVSVLPSAVSGQAYFLTTDKRLYFSVGSNYYSSPVPNNFEVILKSTGKLYIFNGTTLVESSTLSELDTRLDTVELTISGLGTASTKDISFFATPANLDVVSAESHSYTDSAKSSIFADFANNSNPAKGAGLVGYMGTTLAAAMSGVAKISDLANAVNPVLGASMIGYETGRTVRQKLDQMSIARVDLVSEYGLIEGDAGNAAKIQNAFDTAPIGSTLVFPPWTIGVSTPLTLRRIMNLEMGRCTLRGDFIATDPSSDVLRVAITMDVDGVGDVRVAILRGGKVYNATGGNCALNINPDGLPGLLPQFGLIICEGAYGGYSRAIRIGAANIAGDTNFCTVMGNDLSLIGPAAATAGSAVVDIDKCADGHRILNNLIYAVTGGTGVRVNVVAGAYQTHIADNGIVCRDGALLVSNGARVMFLYNQCEQVAASNQLVPKATVLIQGLAYRSIGCIIYGNNFGGGSFVDYNIAMYNAEGCYIDCNYMNTTGVADILLGNGGPGNTADYNTIGGNNWPRGTRPILTAPCDITRRLKVVVSSGTSGNRGVWRNDVTLSNGWTLSNFEFMLDSSGILHMEGALDSGTVTLGTVMATLPDGYAPRDAMFMPFVTETGTFGFIGANSSSQITAGSIPVSPNNRVEVGHISYPVVSPASFNTGA